MATNTSSPCIIWGWQITKELIPQQKESSRADTACTGKLSYSTCHSFGRASSFMNALTFSAISLDLVWCK